MLRKDSDFGEGGKPKYSALRAVIGISLILPWVVIDMILRKTDPFTRLFHCSIHRSNVWLPAGAKAPKTMDNSAHRDFLSCQSLCLRPSLLSIDEPSYTAVLGWLSGDAPTDAVLDSYNAGVGGLKKALNAGLAPDKASANGHYGTDILNAAKCF